MTQTKQLSVASLRSGARQSVLPWLRRGFAAVVGITAIVGSTLVVGTDTAIAAANDYRLYSGEQLVLQP